MTLKRFHLIFGILIFVVFVLTGQYMQHFHNRLQGMEDFPRILFRSRHIYILFASLVNLGIGTYFIYWQERWRKVLQIVGSVLIVVCSVSLVAAFFYETSNRIFDTPFSRFGVIVLALGTGLHLISGLGKKT